MTSKNIEDLDLYAILDVGISASESEIKKAYRKKALQCHPDKNPDNPQAAATFHELSKALEILTDKAARDAYDKVLRAKEAARIRHSELDSKRQKLKDDLERREREAGAGKGSNLTDAQKLATEIARLQKEGSRLLHEEQQRVKNEILRSRHQQGEPHWDSALNRIKIKWTVEKGNNSNICDYDEATLRRILKKYGHIENLIISPAKKGCALVEFSTKEASEMAIEFEKGLPENPLKLKWLSKSSTSDSSKKKSVGESSLVTDRDYESIVLTKLRQAAERQKLIDEMLKEDQGIS